jgi:hypothetical protein
MPRKPRTAQEAAENARPVGGETTEETEAQVNVPAPEEQEETKDTKEENPELPGTLEQLAAVAAKLRGVDDLRAQRDELIHKAYQQGGKTGKIREAAGISNANLLRISKNAP